MANVCILKKEKIAKENVHSGFKGKRATLHAGTFEHTDFFFFFGLWVGNVLYIHLQMLE